MAEPSRTPRSRSSAGIFRRSRIAVLLVVVAAMSATAALLWDWRSDSSAPLPWTRTSLTAASERLATEPSTLDARGAASVRDALLVGAGAAMMALAALALRRRLRLDAPLVLTPAQLPAIAAEPVATAVVHFAGGAYDAIADGVVVSDAADRIVLVNRAFTTLTGLPAADVIGVRIDETGLGLGGARLQAELIGRLEREPHVRAEVKRHCRDGHVLPTWLTISGLRDDSGRIGSYVRVLTDLVPLKAEQERLERAAYRDALTGLPNRRMFVERLEQALRRARRSGRSVSVLYIDLDGFKAVNDTYGHEVGDALLVGIAGRLNGCLRECDCLCRLGGDEFTALLEDVQDEDDALAVRERMHEALAEPFPIDGFSIAGAASIGIANHPAGIGMANSPGGGGEAAALLRQADEAMYRIKKRSQAIGRAAARDMGCAAASSTMA